MPNPTHSDRSSRPEAPRGHPTYEYAVDSDADYCPTCGQPFRTDHLLTLHRGERHPETLDEAEQEHYDEVRDEEDEQLFIFHLKVVAAITLVTFVFIYSYTFVWL